MRVLDRDGGSFGHEGARRVIGQRRIQRLESGAPLDVGADVHARATYETLGGESDFHFVR